MPMLAPLAPLATTPVDLDSVRFGRQAIDRGECLGVAPSADMAVAWPDRIGWHDLGLASAEAAGVKDGWASVKGLTISRVDAADQRVRRNVATVLLRAIAELRLPSTYHALDFTGVPLTEPVLEAILAFARRIEPVGLIVIAEPLDAFYLARHWR